MEGFHVTAFPDLFQNCCSSTSDFPPVFRNSHISGIIDFDFFVIFCTFVFALCAQHVLFVPLLLLEHSAASMSGFVDLANNE